MSAKTPLRFTKRFLRCVSSNSFSFVPQSSGKQCVLTRRLEQGLKPECLALVKDSEVLDLINSCIGLESERYVFAFLTFYFDSPQSPQFCILNLCFPV